MAETYRPYCYRKNVSKVAYCFRGVNKSKNKVLGKRKITKFDFLILINLEN